MAEKADHDNETPDLVRHYKPVAIRSVLAAHALIKHPAGTSTPEVDMTSSFSLPEGFHAPIED